MRLILGARARFARSFNEEPGFALGVELSTHLWPGRRGNGIYIWAARGACNV